MKKILFILLLLPTLLLSQDSWVRFEVQFDFYAPAESNFFMVSNSYGDTSMFFQPTTQYEYLDTILAINSGSYTISLRDSFGDGWMSSQPASFRMGNTCQGSIIDWNPVLGSFFQRDTTVTIYPCPPPAPPQLVSAKVIINLDQYPSETSWNISDSNGTVHASGSGYGTQPIYSTIEETVWIPKGPLFFTINDIYGDGLQGSLWQGNDGSYFVKQCNDTLIYGTDPAFGFDSIHSFVSDSCPPILGCTDNDYLEFNYWATVDDSSCVTLKVFGCTDTTMYNWDPNANTMDMVDTCEFTLILHDLMGNGWVGSNLRLLLPDTFYDFTHTGGFVDQYQVGITAPDPIAFVFNIDPLAQFTTIECGFTMINPDGDTLISIMPPFITPGLTYPLITNCGNECIEIVYGCTYPTAINYDSLANTDDVSCYYNPGCTNPVYLEYDGNYDYDDGSCSTLVVLGCMDSLAFNYNPLANTELTGSCIAVVTGCMQPLAFNYNPNANTADTCIAIVYGCMSQLALNYDSLANIDDGSCIGVVYGCTDTLAFNWNPNANVDDNSCVPVIYGCINPTQFNYCDTCNTNDGSCIEILYGCTDSTMFNFNSLANVDNGSCISFIYGCTNPNSINYNPMANTEDFSCIPYIYGCTDPLAINFDSIANTDNGSCIEAIVGCMDANAFNYNPFANVVLGHDSLGCLYAADWCINGSGNPFFLNDECYAWVIEVDNYCCENEWDEICQLTYNHCGDNWSGPLPKRTDKNLIQVTDLLGRPVTKIKNQLLFYRYNDGSVNRKIIIKN
jgi:hypothetical protein|tara:strand:- start:1438 stop:3801 length:2364 start_codon:yes stop_codon:yes gene_type:complete